jgi:pimeloyl-ACP methyl ester carboxylesterase
MAAIERLATSDGETVAFMRRDGRAPTVVWLGGFKSDMTGMKAQALDRWAAANGHSFVRFDYFGHGASTGEFRQGSITQWRDDALAIVDRVAEGPIVLVGSSMGGWIALLAARVRPERVRGLLLIAPAVDFTEFMWAALPSNTRMQIDREGEWLRPSTYDPEPYPITRELIEDGRRHLLLAAPIALPCPVRILHGMRDPDIPWAHSVRLVEALAGEAMLTLVKHGGHRLSGAGDLRRMTDMLQALLVEITDSPTAMEPAGDTVTE